MNRLPAIYFYNGLSKPQILSYSVLTLLDSIQVTDTYRGDITCDLIDDVNHAVKTGDREFMKETLLSYDIFIDASVEDFQQKNARVGLDKNAYLSDFI